MKETQRKNIDDLAIENECGMLTCHERYKGFHKGYNVAYEELKSKIDIAVEALDWYAKGMPFRDDLGNETQAAQEALEKIKAHDEK